ncbi:MAG: 2-amino-4-hydroxy-6-hydroxymethyldihydropteridine diphosphokinase [Deltaproteobacteria bacterium]
MLEGVLAYIGIGSNLDNPLRYCRESIDRLSGVAGIAVERISSFYKTEPVISDSSIREHHQELEKQNWYINAVAEIRTTLLPGDLLQVLRDIENKMGRVRTFAGAPRIIDLDLLLYGQDIIHDAALTVPHAEMHKRLFVLEPMCEIASYLIHPVFGVSMRGLKERLGDQKIVEYYRPGTAGDYDY